MKVEAATQAANASIDIADVYVGNIYMRNQIFRSKVRLAQGSPFKPLNNMNLFHHREIGTICAYSFIRLDLSQQHPRKLNCAGDGSATPGQASAD